MIRLNLWIYVPDGMILMTSWTASERSELMLDDPTEKNWFYTNITLNSTNSHMSCMYVCTGALISLFLSHFVFSLSFLLAMRLVISIFHWKKKISKLTAGDIFWSVLLLVFHRQCYQMISNTFTSSNTGGVEHSFSCPQGEETGKHSFSSESVSYFAAWSFNLEVQVHTMFMKPGDRSVLCYCCFSKSEVIHRSIKCLNEQHTLRSRPHQCVRDSAPSERRW